MTCTRQNGLLTAYRRTQKARAGGRHSGAPALASARLRNCTVTQEARRASCDTRRNRTPTSRLYGFCGSDNGHDNPCCYLASLLPASVPFPSGGFAARSPRKEVGERIGKEWVIDKSLIDFSVFTYIFILLRRIYLHRIFRYWISRRRLIQHR